MICILNNQINIKLSPATWELLFFFFFPLEQNETLDTFFHCKANVAFHRHKGEGALGAVAPEKGGRTQAMASFGVIRL